MWKVARAAASLAFMGSIGTLASTAFAGGFSCAPYSGGQSYLEVVDTSSKKFDIYFATAAQCDSVSKRLHDAELNRADLPMEVCGCERWVIPTLAVGLTRKIAYLNCYDIAKDGTISETNVARFTALWSDPVYDCERARQNSPNIEPVPPHKL